VFNPEIANLKLTSFLILTALFVLPECKKTETPVSADLVINAGFVCGWGSGLDSINITQTSVTYRYWVPHTSLTAVINKTRSVSESEWKAIMNDLDQDEFVKLNYQSCNVCVDGCDEWISVQGDKISHKITFGKGTVIVEISRLQDKLAELRAEFGN
jgi:hypothetical protein